MFTLRLLGDHYKTNWGKQRGGVIVFRDVTERKRTEEALARAYTQGQVGDCRYTAPQYWECYQ